jgi:thymidylate synthase
MKLLDLIIHFGFSKTDSVGRYREFLNVMVSLDASGSGIMGRLRLSGRRIGMSSEPILMRLRDDPHSAWAVYVGDGFTVQGVISGDHYNQTTYVGSIDAYRDWDAWVSSSLRLAEEIVGRLNDEFRSWYRIGYITLFMFSARIREHDLDEARGILDRHGGVFREFVADPRGNFIIRRVDGYVVVEHRDPRDNSLISSNRFTSLREAYDYFKNRPIFTNYSHALYLGKELTRAFLTRNYVQDEEDHGE